MVDLTGKESLLRQMVAEGMRYVFGNPGTTEQAFTDMLDHASGLSFILCLHEGVAVSMADAYARATRSPAFVELHIAPGLGNGIGMLYNAFAGHSPLVVYVGQSSQSGGFQEPLLSGNLVAMASPVSKWAHEITRAADVPQAVRRAVKLANEPPKGPVVLSIPIDVMDERAAVTIGATCETPWRTPPEPFAIDRAAALLASSTRPVIIVGDGVSLCDAQEEVARLAELLGAPIYTGYASEANVPFRHGLHAGGLPVHDIGAPQLTKDILRRHDVALAVGTPVFRFIFPQEGNPIPDETKLIHIDVDGWEIGKNVPATVGVKGDCRVALAGICEALGGPIAGARERVALITTRTKEKRERELHEDRRSWDAKPISVARLMYELAGVLPSGAAVFDEATTASRTLVRYVGERPGQYFRARGGGLGAGLPGGVGLKLAMPERPVIAVVSDGAAMYTVSALWTAAHYRIPVVWVICNNGAYKILKDNLRDYLKLVGSGHDFVGLDLVDPPLRYDRIADSFGVHGRRVEATADLRPALEEALQMSAPALVEVMLQE